MGIQHKQNEMTSLLSEPHAAKNESIKKIGALTPTPAKSRKNNSIKNNPKHGQNVLIL